MIIGKNIRIKWNKNNKKRFEEKGYKFTNYRDEFLIKLEDLNPDSIYEVDCKCDYCGKEFFRAYYTLLNSEKHTCGNQECKKKLRKETFMSRYGVDNPSKIYEVKVKIAETKFKKQSAFVSPQQRYLANLFNGVTNYNVEIYLIDVALLDSMIAIEFDGKGHDLPVSMHKISRDEFEENERKRENVIFKHGFSLVRIVSSDDYLFDSNELLKLFDICKNKFQNKEEHKIVIDIDNKVMYGENFSEKLHGKIYDITKGDLNDNRKEY